MKRRDEEDVIIGLQDIRCLPLEFPVSVIDENKDSRAAVCTSVSLVAANLFGADIGSARW